MGFSDFFEVSNIFIFPIFEIFLNLFDFFQENQQKNQTFSKQSQNLGFLVNNFQRVLVIKHVENFRLKNRDFEFFFEKVDFLLIFFGKNQINVKKSQKSEK